MKASNDRGMALRTIRRSAGILVLLIAAGVLPLAAQSQAPAPAMQTAAADASYVIGADDVLDISVWKEPDVSRVVPVRPDGKISLPLVSDVQAAGLTPS